MSMMQMLVPKLLFLMAGTAITWPGGTYVHPAHTFKLHVPVGYRVRTGPEKGSDSYIPVCSDASVVCFEYPANRYAGSNFGSASVEVTVLDGKSADACIHPGRGVETADATTDYTIDRANPTRVIDRVTFVHNQGGGVAMGHSIGFDRYWGFDGGTCYELSMAITISVYSKDVDRREFTRRDEAKVTAQLNAILGSFHAR